MHNRHPHNPNLTLTYESDLHGLPLLPKHGPYIENYLDQILATIHRAMQKHARVTAIRFDLRLPSLGPIYESDVITRFFASLQSKLAADQHRKGAQGLRVRSHEFDRVWVREQHMSDHCHYHCCILLSGDSYHHLGSFKEQSGSTVRPNMAKRIREAWASALRISFSDSVGLVHFPKNRVYHLNANSENLIYEIGSLFERLSYFAKVDTKQYGDGYNNFGCSRK